MNLSEWVADVEGRVIGSGQCVGLAQDYSTRVAGGGFLSTDTGPYPGYAGNMWTSNITGYVRKPASSIMLPGWLPIWGKSAFTPSTHVAVGLADAGVGILCMTQNPGAAKQQVIPKIGLLGYLAPANGNSGGSIHTAVDMEDIAGAAGTVAGALTGPMQSLQGLSAWVSDSGNWQRVGLYTLGALLIIFAVVFMFKNQVLEVVK